MRPWYKRNPNTSEGGKKYSKAFVFPSLRQTSVRQEITYTPTSKEFLLIVKGNPNT